MKIKNSNLKASVLVANYNNSKFIDKCIKSIINQTYNNIEIIFIDDRSTDNSLKVAKKYSHKIKLISQKKNLGLDVTTKFPHIMRVLRNLLVI